MVWSTTELVMMSLFLFSRSKVSCYLLLLCHLLSYIYVPGLLGRFYQPLGQGMVLAGSNSPESYLLAQNQEVQG